MANIIVIVGNNRDSIPCSCFGWGARELYVRGKYMPELRGKGCEILIKDLFRNDDGASYIFSEIVAEAWPKKPSRLISYNLSCVCVLLLSSCSDSSVDYPSGSVPPSRKAWEGGVGTFSRSCTLTLLSG